MSRHGGLLGAVERVEETGESLGVGRAATALHSRVTIGAAISGCAPGEIPPEQTQSLRTGNAPARSTAIWVAQTLLLMSAALLRIARCCLGRSR